MGYSSPACRCRSVGRGEQRAEAMSTRCRPRRADHLNSGGGTSPPRWHPAWRRAKRDCLCTSWYTLGHDAVPTESTRSSRCLEHVHQRGEVGAAGRRKSQVVLPNGMVVTSQRRLRRVALLARRPSTMQGQPVDHGRCRQDFSASFHCAARRVVRAAVRRPGRPSPCLVARLLARA